MRFNSRQYSILGIIFILLWAIVISAFWPSLYNQFIFWDDPIYLVENELVRSLSWPNVRAIFTTDVSLNYTPLTILSFAWEYQSNAMHFWVYHWHNILLHCLNVSLVLILGFSLTRSLFAGAIAAFIFALHPMHVESVAWITERKDVLYTFFYLLALIFYRIYQGEQLNKWYLLSLFCGFLSILSKPMALSLPLVILFLDWFEGRKQRLKILLPFFIVTWPIAFWTYSLNSRIIDWNIWKSPLIWLWTLSFYIWKFFWPNDFLLLYQLPKPVDIMNPSYLMALGLVFAILVFIFVFRHCRWLIFAFGYFFISIFFLLRFDEKMDLCIVADRFMYLPSLGFCLGLGVFSKAAWDWLISHKRIQGYVWILFLGGILTCLAHKTHEQTKLWGDETQFWTKVISQEPQLALAYNQRGLSLQAQGRFKEAKADYSRAIALFPEYDFAYMNRGIILKSQGEYLQALNDYTKAIAINPDLSEAYFNRGNVYFNCRDYSRAVDDYTMSLQTRTKSARRHYKIYESALYSSRGTAFFYSDDYDKAFIDFVKALEINPDNIVALDNRAIIYIIQGKTSQALNDLEHSLKLAANNPANYLNRAKLYHLLGREKEAMRDVQKSLALRPDNMAARELKDNIESGK